MKSQPVGGTAGPEALALQRVRRLRAPAIQTVYPNLQTKGRKQKVGGAMKTPANYREKVVRAMGTTMMIVWVLVLGPVGALLLGGLAYAMLAKSLVAGAFCAILIFLPFFVTLAWGTVGLLANLLGSRYRQAEVVLTTDPIASFKPAG